MKVALAVRNEERTAFGCSNSRLVGSNLTRSRNVLVCAPILTSVLALSCVGETLRRPVTHPLSPTKRPKNEKLILYWKGPVGLICQQVK
jgi:hypothetical protein